jgi:hypothetical protein
LKGILFVEETGAESEMFQSVPPSLGMSFQSILYILQLLFTATGRKGEQVTQRMGPAGIT